MPYSFIKTREEILLHTVMEDIPHVVLVLFVALNLESKQLEARIIDTSEVVKKVDISSFHDEIMEERQKKSMQTQWFSPNDISFFPKKQKDIYGFFDEKNINLLSIPIVNPEDHQRDFLYVLYDKNQIDPELRKKQKLINTVTKLYIAKVTTRRISSILNDYEQNMSFLRKEMEDKAFEEKKFEEKNEKNKILKQELDKSHDYIVDSIIKKLEPKKYVELSDESHLLLRKYRNKFDFIERLLENALERAKRKQFLNDSLYLHEWYFDEEEVAESLNQKFDIVLHTDREQKIFATLEDIQQSILVVRQKGKKTVVRNIKVEMNHQLGPQAITDRFHRYREEIIAIYNRDPDRWETLYTSFKPFQNIVD